MCPAQGPLPATPHHGQSKQHLLGTSRTPQRTQGMDLELNSFPTPFFNTPISRKALWPQDSGRGGQGSTWHPWLSWATHR